MTWDREDATKIIWSWQVYGSVYVMNCFIDKLLNNKLDYVTAHKRYFIEHRGFM